MGPAVINVTPPGMSSWTIPNGDDYANIAAKVGDTLVFEYSASHDVYQLVGSSCPASKPWTSSVATQLASASVGGGSGALPNKFEKVLNTAGTFTFACSVETHCLLGHKVTVTVAGPRMTTSAGFQPVPAAAGLLLAAVLAAIG